MNRVSKSLLCVLNLAVVLVVLEAVAQEPARALVVNGKPVSASLIQREGHFYVDIEALAQALGGSIAFQPNQIALSIGQQSAAPESEPAKGLSKEFQRSSVLSLGNMREWGGAIGTLISYGAPVTGDWARQYHDRTDRDLMQLAVTASTDEDREALQLLKTLSVDLGKWADNVVADRQGLNAARSVDPNALQNDQVRAKIIRCEQFLGSMIVRGTFADDSSCH